MNDVPLQDQRQFRSLNVDGSGAKHSGGLEIDFTFNTIKNVKKVQWKSEAPWYREINDGFCWLAYCQNQNLNEEMVLKAEMRARFGPQGTSSMSIYEFKEQSGLNTTMHGNYPCPALKQLVVINRGYDIFALKKDLTNGILRCPCCRTSKFLNIRNCGFVNCEWSMRGILRTNKESKIYADGRTYDSKLYTFKECDYMTIW